jgi:ERF superfamily
MGPNPKVYAAISKVMAEIGRTGIAKDRSNQQQGFKFRGIDDVYNAMSPLLAAAGLCVLPRVTSRQVTERATKSGGVLFYVALDVEFDLCCAEDGSKHTIAVSGEAMDSGDKATNKAMSAAFKYACMQVFCIPTEGNPDADAETHDVAPVVAASTEVFVQGEEYVDPEQAFASSAAMRDLLEADLDHRVKTLKIFDKHLVLTKTEPLYSAASKKLKPAERTAWKAYVKEAKELEKDDRTITNTGKRF